MSRLRLVVPVLLSLGGVAGPSVALGQVVVGVSITIAPPLLPVYAQPVIPGSGYLWTPGYWAYGPDGYYWVPGTWVLPPAIGLLWTPAWWGWSNGVYVFHPGYWGPQVGFYGGINYGYGYGGVGYLGGYWNHGVFAYNRAVNNIGRVHIASVYSRAVVSNPNHVSFNGGQGGIAARPTPQQEAYARASHTPPTPLQIQHQQAAGGNHALLATVNHGSPPIAATSRPGAFTRAGAVPARNAVGATRPVGAPGSANPAQHGPTAPGPAIERSNGAAPALRPPAEAARPAAPHGGPATPGTVAPAAQVRNAPAPVHPPVAPQVRPVTAPQVGAAPAPHPQVAPAPRAEPRPAPDHDEKKPPG